MVGDFEDAVAAIEGSLPELGDWPVLIMTVSAIAGEAYHWLGDHERAASWTDRGVAAVSDTDVLSSAELLALALRVHPGDASLLERLEGLGNGYPEPEAHKAVGRAEHAVDDPELWALAGEAWKELDRRYNAAYARWREAQALARSHGDRDALIRALSAAYETADAVSAPHVLTAITALARRARVAIPGLIPTPPCSRSSPAGSTRCSS